MYSVVSNSDFKVSISTALDVLRVEAPTRDASPPRLDSIELTSPKRPADGDMSTGATNTVAWYLFGEISESNREAAAIANVVATINHFSRQKMTNKSPVLASALVFNSRSNSRS